MGLISRVSSRTYSFFLEKMSAGRMDAWRLRERDMNNKIKTEKERFENERIRVEQSKIRYLKKEGWLEGEGLEEKVQEEVEKILPQSKLDEKIAKIKANFKKQEEAEQKLMQEQKNKKKKKSTLR